MHGDSSRHSMWLPTHLNPLQTLKKLQAFLSVLHAARTARVGQGGDARGLSLSLSTSDLHARGTNLCSIHLVLTYKQHKQQQVGQLASIAAQIGAGFRMSMRGVRCTVVRSMARQGKAGQGEAGRAGCSTAWQQIGSGGGARFVAFIWFLQMSTRNSNRSGR